MKAMRFQVFGQVQGVGFRWFVARHSRRLGLDGLARNQADGSVEVIAVGAEEALAELTKLLETGPAHADVTGVEKEEISHEGITYKSFEIM